MKKTKSIDALVNEAKNGDKDAFNELYKKYKPMLYSFIAQRNKNNPFGIQTEDLVQESFIKAFCKINKYNNNLGLFTTWLFKIANNLIIDASRQNRIKTMSIDVFFTNSDTPEIRLNIPDTSNNNPIERQEEICCVKKAIKILESDKSKIKKRMARILLLRYVEEKTYREITKITGLDETTVKGDLFKAKKKLKEIIEKLLR